MTRPFLPPPEAARCCAVVSRNGFSARCPRRREWPSDLCRRCEEQALKGQRIVRVSPPREVA
jgi:hypothetical protein